MALFSAIRRHAVPSIYLRHGRDGPTNPLLRPALQKSERYVIGARSSPIVAAARDNSQAECRNMDASIPVLEARQETKKVKRAKKFGTRQTVIPTLIKIANCISERATLTRRDEARFRNVPLTRKIGRSSFYRRLNNNRGRESVDRDSCQFAISRWRQVVARERPKRQACAFEHRGGS